MATAIFMRFGDFEENLENLVPGTVFKEMHNNLAKFYTWTYYL